MQNRKEERKLEKQRIKYSFTQSLSQREKRGESKGERDLHSSACVITKLPHNTLQYMYIV